MAIFARKLRPSKGTVTNGVISLFGNFTSNGGTAGSVSCDGFTIAKTGSTVGRYTVTLDGQVTELLGASTTVIAAHDTNAIATASGVVSAVRANTVATDGKFNLQFISNVDQADADVTTSSKVLIRIDLKLSTVNP
jgi:hypothetical protein